MFIPNIYPQDLLLNVSRALNIKKLLRIIRKLMLNIFMNHMIGVYIIKYNLMKYKMKGKLIFPTAFLSVNVYNSKAHMDNITHASKQLAILVQSSPVFKFHHSKDRRVHERKDRELDTLSTSSSAASQQTAARRPSLWGSENFARGRSTCANRILNADANWSGHAVCHRAQVGWLRWKMSLLHFGALLMCRAPRLYIPDPRASCESPDFECSDSYLAVVGRSRRKWFTVGGNFCIARVRLGGRIGIIRMIIFVVLRWSTRRVCTIR